MALIDDDRARLARLADRYAQRAAPVPSCCVTDADDLLREWAAADVVQRARMGLHALSIDALLNDHARLQSTVSALERAVLQLARENRKLEGRW
jgi:hypothetical protein